MKRKSTKAGDRVIATCKIGLIRAGDEGRVIEVLPLHERTNPHGTRRTVRFDELPHDYVVNDRDLCLVPDPDAKPRDAKGRFAACENNP